MQSVEPDVLVVPGACVVGDRDGTGTVVGAKLVELTVDDNVVAGLCFALSPFFVDVEHPVTPTVKSATSRLASPGFNMPAIG